MDKLFMMMGVRKTDMVDEVQLLMDKYALDEEEEMKNFEYFSNELRNHEHRQNIITLGYGTITIPQEK